ncbi:MAG TPA: HAMP domain-containing sensor histidine kinase [Pyrinomonadaceae bacterium]|jgi:signal transduction histidine kinase|nr:HAMP domain-containing sensor histidine kinase [Pyrinomonadaceae bacterium]
MVQKLKRASGVSATTDTGEREVHAAGVSSPPACGAAADELQALSAEIVGLLNEQALSAGEPRTESEVCESFSEIVQRHWGLCCVAVFLRGDEGRLHLCANFHHEHVEETRARRAAEALAAGVERAGEEFRVGAGETATQAELRGLFDDASRAEAAAVPIRAGGELVGVLTVAAREGGRVSAAVGGIRCVGQAVVIALGNARRSAAMSEQHRRIESLVEELRRRTAELEDANLELQRVGRYRSLFLARMSHELRTPLTSILGFAEILIDQERLTDTQRRFCEKIQSSGFQLQASLNQLVDLSRLEAGQTELFLHEFSIRETLRESCAAVARLAQKQGVSLDCTPVHELGGLVSDEGKLRQVLYNFLAFAIGRSPAGGVVRIGAVPREGDRLRIEIADEGEPLEDHARLFEPVDVDAPNERGTNMNELGLVIAHRLLAVLGGTVSLRDLSPKGLSVHINLPARPAGN